MYDFLIIGGGTVGCCLARELARCDVSVAVAEARTDVCASENRTGGVICAARTLLSDRPAAAKYAALGEKMFRSYCAALEVPYSRTGCLYAYPPDEAARAHLVAVMCRSLGIACEELDAARVPEAEPALASYRCSGALYFPESGTADACEFVYALKENAESNGVHFRFGFEAVGAEYADGEISVISQSGERLTARRVINCAGNGGGLVARAFGDLIYLGHESVNIVAADCRAHPRMPVLFPHGRFIAPLPGGGYFAGSDICTSRRAAASVTGAPDAEAWLKSEAGITLTDSVGIAQMRAYTAGGDMLDIKGRMPGVRHIIGLGDFGMTAAPALASAVARSYGLAPRKDFDPVRHAAVRVRFLSAHERNALARKDKSYAVPVLADPFITEGEVRDAVARGANTAAGLGRRLLGARENGGARLTAALGKFCPCLKTEDI